MVTRVAQWRTAWVALALAIGLHIADEALTGFLPLYNGIVGGIRAKHLWVPLPTFAFPIWLGVLIVEVLILLSLAPVVSRGARWIRVFSRILGILMIGNATAHMGMSVYWGRFISGVYSSPILLIAAVTLLVTASRTKALGWQSERRGPTPHKREPGTWLDRLANFLIN